MVEGREAGSQELIGMAHHVDNHCEPRLSLKYVAVDTKTRTINHPVPLRVPLQMTTELSTLEH